MLYSKSTPARSLLICMLSTLLFLSQTAEAAGPVSKQLRKFPIGSAIQVHMADGRILEETLVASSVTNFELRESGQGSVETVEYGDVKAVNQISALPGKKRPWLAAAIVVGAVVAAGVGASHAGGFY